MGWIGFGLLVTFIMMFVAYAIHIVAVRFMPHERARKLAILTTAALSLPVLVPGGVGLGLAFLAGVALLSWQLSAGNRDAD